MFDPLNLLNNATSIQEVRRWRESEITHGRVAMLASVGWLVGEYVANKKLLVNGDGRISGAFLALRKEGMHNALDDLEMHLERA